VGYSNHKKGGGSLYLATVKAKVCSCRSGFNELGKIGSQYAVGLWGKAKKVERTEEGEKQTTTVSLLTAIKSSQLVE